MRMFGVGARVLTIKYIPAYGSSIRLLTRHAYKAVQSLLVANSALPGDEDETSKSAGQSVCALVDHRS